MSRARGNRSSGRPVTRRGRGRGRGRGGFQKGDQNPAVKKQRLEETCWFIKMSEEDAKKWLIGIQKSDHNMREMMSRNKERESTMCFKNVKKHQLRYQDVVDRANVEGGWEDDYEGRGAVNDNQNKHPVMMEDKKRKRDDEGGSSTRNNPIFVLSKIQEICLQMAHSNFSRSNFSNFARFDFSTATNHPGLMKHQQQEEDDDEEEETSYEEFLASISARNPARNCSEETIAIDMEDQNDKLLLFAGYDEQQDDQREDEYSNNDISSDDDDRMPIKFNHNVFET